MPITKTTLSDVAYKLLTDAAMMLPASAKQRIYEAYERETVSGGKTQLRAILENIETAESQRMCLCQDTGLPLFFVTLGLKAQVHCDIKAALTEATERATKDVPYRENVIHPLTKKNSGTNTGWGMPYVYYAIEPEADYLEITAVPKGLGSEAKSALVFVTTDKPIAEATIRCVLDNVSEAMGEPCPPTIVGVGLGGTGDIAMTLAKKAILREPIGSHHPDPSVAELESRLLEAVNATGIGPMAMGGDTTALAVHVEMCGAHTAVVPVAVTFQCWAARSSKARIHSDGGVEFLTHPR